MQKKKQQLLAALLVAALSVTSLGSAVFAADEPVAVEQEATQPKVTGVSGTLPGGQFAKMWLGLTPSQPGATIVVTAEWDRPNADGSRVGFYILDETGLNAVLNGSGTAAENNIASGSQNFFLNGANNMQGASIRATGTNYTVVPFNDSDAEAKFKLKVENGFLTDDSGQATVDTTIGGTPVAEAETAETATTAAAVATTEATPAATTAAATPVATAAATPAAAVVTSGPVRSTTMEGELPEQFDQHLLGLEPDQRDGTVTLSLKFDPQDSQELARRLNFIVLDEQGFKSYLEGESAFSLAKAAGSRDVVGAASNERQATFSVTGFGPYTVIVYNNSNVPATYDLTATGGILVDDSGQTTTAKNAGGSAPAATTGTTTTTTPATPAVAATTAAAATTETTGREGEPGGTYTVKSGDTLALIAQDIYGDYRLYEQICAFNGLANCDLIEVGDVIKLPTSAQLQSGAVAETTTTTAAATPTPTPAPVVATTTTTTTAATATTATTATTTTAPTTAVTTTTAPTSAVTSTTPATTTTSSAGAAATGESIVNVLQDAGQFSILLSALDATGLEQTVAGTGPFTLFAPTDAAFNQLLADTGLTEARLLQAGQLPEILRLHMLSGKVFAADLTDGAKGTTLLGKPVTFKISDGEIKVNDSVVVTSDIPASNGIIHVIDKVMLVPTE